MKNIRKAPLMATAALAASWGAGPAAAQDQVQSPTGPEAEAESPAIQDIIVTARKTEERLNDAPVAVTAFTAEVLEDRNLRDLNDIASFTPGLSFSQAFGRSTDRPVIRGLSNVLAGVQFGVESGASIFVDGALFRGDIQTLNFDALERIEVIKGPQSALYGRNTYAGAINFITKTPGNKFRGQVKGRLAENEEYEITAGLDIPIAPDLLAVRVDGRYFTYGGEYRNQLTGKKVGSEESSSIAGTLYATPDENVTIRARLQYSKDDDGPIAFFLQPASENNCRPGFRSAAFRRGGTLTSTNANQYFCGVIRPRPELVQLNTDRLADGTPDGTAFDGVEVDRWFATINADWDINGSGVILNGIGSYRDEKLLFGSDSDFSNANIFFGNPATTEPLFANTTRSDIEDYSIEARLTTPQDLPLRGLIGFYTYDFTDIGRDLTFNAPRAGEPYGTAGSDRPTVDNSAVFMRVEGDILPNLTVGAEGRIFTETKRLIEFGARGVRSEQPEFRTDGVDPRFTIDWKPTPETLLYAIYAEGTKPGGLNGGAGTSIGRPAYGDENLKGGEIGLKQGLFRNRVQVNLSAYYNDVSNVQLTTSVPNPSGVGALTSVVTNQGNAEVKGLEVEIQAAPLRQLNLSATYAYIDAKFTAGCDDFEYVLNSGGFRISDSENPTPAEAPLCSIEGKRLPLGSPHQASVSADWKDALTPDLDYMINVNASYEASKFIQVHNLAETGDTVLVNAKVGIGGERWEVSLFGRNLTNEDSIPLATRWFDLRYGFAPRVGGPGGIPPAVIGRADTGLPRAFFTALRKGRSFGVEAKFKF